MIALLAGKVLSIEVDHCIIDTGGVGYLVYVSSYTARQMNLHHNCQLYIEMVVKEDDISLFGFFTKEEKHSFKLLQSVQGVGNKMAMAILSTLAPEAINLAIASKDIAAFKTVSGVGPKLASRLVNELQGKAFFNNVSINNNLGNPNLLQDAVLALGQLGFAQSAAYQVVQGVMQSNPQATIEEIITLALQELAK